MPERNRPRALSEGSWAAVAAVGSRLLLAVVAVLTTLTIGVSSRALFLRDPRHAEVLEGFAKRLFEPWAHWDGVWFVRIAADGYGAHESSQAFFPLYPLLVRTVAPFTGGSYVIAGVAVSLLCYAGAMVLLYRLAKAELGARIALWSVVFISVFPTALVFQAVYSESLFLLLALACFAAGRRGHWLLAGVMGLLATLTRSSGLVLLLPLAIMWWEQRRGAPLRLPGGPSGGKAPARRPAIATLACLLLVPAGLALYMAYLWRAFGDPLLFGVVQGSWGRGLAAPMDGRLGRRRPRPPRDRLAARPRSGRDRGNAQRLGGIPLEILGNVVEFVGLVVALVLLVACWRKLPAAYTAYAVAALLFPLFYPAAGRPLSNLPRFVLVDFPLFIGLAAALVPHRVARWVVAGGMLVLLVVATVYFASWS